MDTIMNSQFYKERNMPVELNNTMYRRQNGIYNPYTQNRPVTIIGCGSLGSMIGVGLSKLGLNRFTLWDNDIVEQHNLPNQAFASRHLGTSKVGALAELIHEYAEVNSDNIRYMQQHWDWTQDIEPGLIINAPDDIDVRKEVFQNAPFESFIVDVRSGPDSFNVLCCDKKNKEDTDYYNDSFFNAANVAGADCNARSTVFASYLIAAIALHQYVAFANMKPYRRRIDGCLHTLDMMAV